MLIQATVIKQTKTGVELETRKDCGGCKSCKPRVETFFVATKKKYKIGQQVNVDVNTAYFWRALVLLICLPLFTLVAVLVVLIKAGLLEILAAAISLLICLAEYVAIYFYDKTLKTADFYKIVS